MFHGRNAELIERFYAVGVNDRTMSSPAPNARQTGAPAYRFVRFQGADTTETEAMLPSSTIARAVPFSLARPA